MRTYQRVIIGFGIVTALVWLLEAAIFTKVQSGSGIPISISNARQMQLASWTYFEDNGQYPKALADLCPDYVEFPDIFFFHVDPSYLKDGLAYFISVQEETGGEILFAASVPLERVTFGRSSWCRVVVLPQERAAKNGKYWIPEAEFQAVLGATLRKSLSDDMRGFLPPKGQAR